VKKKWTVLLGVFALTCTVTAGAALANTGVVEVYDPEPCCIH